MYDDEWCYSETSEYRYNLDTMVFQHLTRQDCLMYDVETDQFVQGSLEMQSSGPVFIKA